MPTIQAKKKKQGNQIGKRKRTALTLLNTFRYEKEKNKYSLTYLFYVPGGGCWTPRGGGGVKNVLVLVLLYGRGGTGPRANERPGIKDVRGKREKKKGGGGWRILHVSALLLLWVQEREEGGKRVTRGGARQGKVEG